jgi:hypothetical protein
MSQQQLRTDGIAIAEASLNFDNWASISISLPQENAMARSAKDTETGRVHASDTRIASFAHSRLSKEMASKPELLRQQLI